MANNGIATTNYSIEPIAPFTRSPIATPSNLSEAPECKQWLYKLHCMGDRPPHTLACTTQALKCSRVL
ncbi:MULTISPECIES: hypothetical protein [unclassified Microcoleus]|uniref:hypothetical protein n=1 Tax=unclassified Microcoleus TaxID=2642155 RepID=UPI002FCE7D4D